MPLQISKKQLEIQLSKLKIPSNPKLELEQYPVSAEVAAELLHMASFEYQDLHEKNIIDLGTGTGLLAIGSILLGAQHVTGVDVDPEALQLARDNAALLDVKIDWKQSDIAQVTGQYDTVLMNPPYGTRIEHADKIFLEKAFQLAPITYSIHKTSTRQFVEAFTKDHNRTITDMRSMILKIPHLYQFHSHKWKGVEVDLYRIIS